MAKSPWRRRKAERNRTFMARNTHRPLEDVERGFSSWLGSAHNSKAETIEWGLFDESSPFGEDYFDPDPVWRDWQAASGVAEHATTEWDRDTYMPPEFFEWANDNHFHMDVRPHKEKWFLVDHEGLAGYRVEAKNKAEAIAEGNAQADTGHGLRVEGDSTVGDIRYEGPLDRPDWHLFSADDVITEHAARNSHAGIDTL
jgi:hypothetical protein